MEAREYGATGGRERLSFATGSDLTIEVQISAGRDLGNAAAKLSTETNPAHHRSAGGSACLRG